MKPVPAPLEPAASEQASQGLRRTLDRVRFTPRSLPLALLLLCLLSFGVLLPLLGFYWDDWPTVYFIHQLGPGGFQRVFAEDRPALGWLFVLTTSLFGESALGWQVFGLLARWLAALAFWQVLRLTWPARSREAAWAALAFAVYPGFGQQYIAVTYSHTWLTMAGFFASLSLMLLAARKPRRFWLYSLPAWLLAAYILFADEYWFGLELLRPLLLWIVYSESSPEAAPLASKEKVRRILPQWLPYILILLVFLVWRLFLHVSPRGTVQVFDQLSQGPLAAALSLAGRILFDFVEVTLLAWAQAFNFPALSTLNSLQLASYLFLTLLVVILSAVYLLRLRAASAGSRRNWAVQAILLGLFALAVGGIPYWATYLPIMLTFPFDRFTLAMMFGASLVLTGALELLIPSERVRALSLALLLGLAAGYQFQTSIHFRQEWTLQKQFFWQLAWRAPAIEPGTVLLTAGLPFTYYSDNSLTGPLNWIWAPDSTTPQMPYSLYDMDVNLEDADPGLQANQPIQQPYRARYFNGSTSQALVVFFDPPRCVKVLDPQYDARLPKSPDRAAQAVMLSDIALISPSPDRPARPPIALFGPEPPHDWCYFYEKAELARQSGDWPAAAGYADQALALGREINKQNAPDLAPFIEAYARTGQWEQAEQLSLQGFKTLPNLRDLLCQRWTLVTQTAPGDADGQAALARIQKKLSCKAP